MTAEAASEGLEVTLFTLWSESRLIVSDLLSLLCYNIKERCAYIDWDTEYNMLPINFLRRMYFYLHTW